jgi:hypothetical protein
MEPLNPEDSELIQRAMATFWLQLERAKRGLPIRDLFVHPRSIALKDLESFSTRIAT